MASEITIAGHKFPKWVVWASAIGGVGAVYLAYRAHKNAAAAAATTAATQSGIDPVTGLPYSEDSAIDPVTGMTYLQEAQEYGSVSAADASVSQSASDAGYSDEDYGESGLAAGEPDYYSSAASTTYSTNAEWVSAATTGLESLGYAASDVNTALANYLAGLSLTSTQATIVQAAIAEFGPPPVGTFAINVQSTASGATSTGTSSTGTSSTTTTGTSSTSSTGSTGTSSTSSTTAKSTATPETAPINVRASTSGAVTTISWQAVGAVEGYEYQIAEPSGELYRSGSVTVPSGSFDNLVDIAKGTWHFKCRAFNAAGFGPWSSVIAFTP
jgi:hypothetical protein